jgi:hypothetical protein
MAIIDYMSALPLGVLALLLNVWLMGFALGGMWVTRRYVMPWMKLSYDDAYFAAVVVQSVMLLYGLIAALTTVSVWQRYDQVSAIVSAEATAIASLWRDLGGYPEPLREETRAVLRGYTEQVIQGAWPQQRRGEVPREGVEWMDRLEGKIFDFEPVTEAQKIADGEVIQAFNELVHQRRQRLDSVQAALPSVLWWVLLPGAMGCIVLALFFHSPNARLQAVMLVGLAGFLSMVLFVIIALDSPYSGDMGIPADSYQLVIEHYMNR